MASDPNRGGGHVHISTQEPPAYEVGPQHGIDVGIAQTALRALVRARSSAAAAGLIDKARSITHVWRIARDICRDLARSGSTMSPKQRQTLLRWVRADEYERIRANAIPTLAPLDHPLRPPVRKTEE